MISTLSAGTPSELAKVDGIQWPLLPLISGRLLRAKYRHAVVVVSPTLPPNSEQYSASRLAAGSLPDTPTVGGDTHLGVDQEAVTCAKQAQVDQDGLGGSLPQLSDLTTDPWSWLLPMADRMLIPVLDPGFNAICWQFCSPQPIAQGSESWPLQDRILEVLLTCSQLGLLEV